VQAALYFAVIPVKTGIQISFQTWTPACAEGRIRPKPCGGFAGVTTPLFA